MPSPNIGGIVGGVVCVLIILILISVALIVFAIIALRYKRSQRKGNLCKQACVYVTEKRNSQQGRLDNTSIINTLHLYTHHTYVINTLFDSC